MLLRAKALAASRGGFLCVGHDTALCRMQLSIWRQGCQAAASPVAGAGCIQRRPFRPCRTSRRVTTCASRTAWSAETSDLAEHGLSRQEEISSGHALDASYQSVPRVVLQGNKARIFRRGTPHVYCGAIDRIVGRPKPEKGDAVIVTDGDDVGIGWGVWNPDSLYRVRMMQLAHEVPMGYDVASALPDLISERIAAAAVLRAALGLPSPDTNVYRLLNSEGDRLSGIVADVLGPALIVAPSAAWAQRFKHDILDALQAATGCADIRWRPSVALMAKEGIELGADAEEEESYSVAAPEEGVVVEGGVRHAVRLSAGQKTGFYVDQRATRTFIRSLASGRRVADLCCYSGAFALNAALGGAASVVGVDTSADALAMARRGAELNGLDPERCAFVQSDVEDFIRKAARRRETFDLVVLDPPKLAPRRTTLTRARSKYASLNRGALSLVAPGGLLLTCSCSGVVTQTPGMLLGIVQEAALVTGRHLMLLRQAGPGPDHPLDPAYPEGNYLTTLLFRVV